MTTNEKSNFLITGAGSGFGKVFATAALSSGHSVVGQVAIVGAGRISEMVVAHKGQPSVRRVLPLSLTFDHRVVTGGEAARFIVTLKSDLERTS